MKTRATTVLNPFLVPFTALAVTTSAFSADRAPHSEALRTDQVGYLPNEPKFAMLASAPTGDVLVRRTTDNSIALTLKPGPETNDPDTGDQVRPLDLSALTTTGTYYLDAPGLGTGDDFTVAPDAFSHAFRLAMRAFTGLRCGTAVSLAPDSPEFSHPPCHTAPALFDPSTGRTGTLECTGGWHDAGDFGRYMTNSGITTATLLYAWELNSPKLKPLNLDLPESHGPLPDVLAEIKWNLDWMLKMQDADGGVFHKASTARFPGMIMPQDDTAPVLIVGTGKALYKTTAATADFAAVCAIASRTYRPFDPKYADRCLAAAHLAWKWLEANPDSNFTKNPQGISTGGYEDRNPADERLFAAAELHRTTGDKSAHDYFLAHYKTWSPTLASDNPQAWPNVQHLAMFAYALSDRPDRDHAVVATITTDAKSAADDIVARSRANPYRIPLTHSQYYWGSNAVAANYAVQLLLTNHLSPNPDYIAAAYDTLHYLLGRNTFNTSFVTGVGSRSPMHPHHRPSAADKLDHPWPGLLVGGPNASGKSPPARQWSDSQDDYRTNEIAINWNAPLVFLLAESLPDPNPKPHP